MTWCEHRTVFSQTAKNIAGKKKKIKPNMSKRKGKLRKRVNASRREQLRDPAWRRQNLSTILPGVAGLRQRYRLANLWPSLSGV